MSLVPSDSFEDQASSPARILLDNISGRHLYLDGDKLVLQDVPFFQQKGIERFNRLPISKATLALAFLIIFDFFWKFTRTTMPSILFYTWIFVILVLAFIESRGDAVLLEIHGGDVYTGKDRLGETHFVRHKIALTLQGYTILGWDYTHRPVERKVIYSSFIRSNAEKIARHIDRYLGRDLPRETELGEWPPAPNILR